MKKVRLVIMVIIVLALMVLAVQNTSPVEAHFLWMSAEIPAVVLLFLTAAGGFVVGLLVALLVKRGAKPKSTSGPVR